MEDHGQQVDLRCKERPMQSRLSRKRYEEIQSQLASLQFSPDSIQAFLDVMCKVLKFDPEDRSLSAYHKSYIHRRAAELGVSTYAASGSKAFYERKRAQRQKAT